MKKLLLLPFFALLMFMSCQQEVVEVTQPSEGEALVANSELTSLMKSTSTKDGSEDNIIDKANCLSVNLPVTVIVNGVEVVVNSNEDYLLIKAVFDESDDDDDTIEIVYPITITLSDYTEVEVNNREELVTLAQECKGENQQDDDIECIDFQYPFSFSVYNASFQVIDVVNIESDRQLHRFIERIREGEVFASINFPITMVLSDGSTVVVNNNQELQATIQDAKDSCNEDDNNDYHDTDFTKERLDILLTACPWVVHDMDRNGENLNDQYRDFAMLFKDGGVVKVHARNGDMLTGTWSTRITDNGALIKLEFDTLVDFTLEWFVYDIEYDRIKLFTEGGNKIILQKNCDIVFEQTVDRIKNYLTECYWRVDRLNVDGNDNEDNYIGTPLKFFADGTVKIRVNGELIAGTWNILQVNLGFALQIHLESRADLELIWLITSLEPDFIKFESLNNKMELERHCFGGDADVTFIENALNAGVWSVAFYQDENVDKTENYFMYSIDFMENGLVKVTDPNNGVINGSWLSYRNEGLFLGLNFGLEAPFHVLNNRWKIVSVTETRIELKDFSSSGTVESILVLERQ